MTNGTEPGTTYLRTKNNTFCFLLSSLPPVQNHHLATAYYLCITNVLRELHWSSVSLARLPGNPRSRGRTHTRTTNLRTSIQQQPIRRTIFFSSSKFACFQRQLRNVNGWESIISNLEEQVKETFWNAFLPFADKLFSYAPPLEKCSRVAIQQSSDYQRHTLHATGNKQQLKNKNNPLNFTVSKARSNVSNIFIQLGPRW